MSIRGQKIHIDLGDDESDQIPPNTRHAPSAANFLGDIQERRITQSTPPKPPAPRSANDGFPAHRKRLYQSRFKSARSVATEAAPTADRPLHRDNASGASPMERIASLANPEQEQIDRENQNRLDSMTDAEIQQERQELLDNINPSIIQALLKRSRLEPGDDQADFPGLTANQVQDPPKTKKPPKKVTFDEPATNDDAGINDHKLPTTPAPILNHTRDGAKEDEEPSQPPDEAVLAGSMHFPRPDQPPDLDPNSPSFLEDLHRKYFPSLPADPEKLEWMKPASEPNPYSTSQSGLNPGDIRFSFSGALIPPSEAAQIPVTAGLHHHGDAPDAAGYTIPELARLARSRVPAQRCIAFQTLGRILYRLGKGEFGNPSEGSSGTVGAEDTLAELARGLWAEVEKEHVVNICTNESEGKSMTGQRHVSAQAYATEAIWLWQKGGGRRWRTD